MNSCLIIHKNMLVGRQCKKGDLQLYKNAIIWIKNINEIYKLDWEMAG